MIDRAKVRMRLAVAGGDPNPIDPAASDALHRVVTEFQRFSRDKVREAAFRFANSDRAIEVLREWPKVASGRAGEKTCPGQTAYSDGD
jgi:hypothetical protein